MCPDTCATQQSAAVSRRTPHDATLSQSTQFRDEKDSAVPTLFNQNPLVEVIGVARAGSARRGYRLVILPAGSTHADAGVTLDSFKEGIHEK
jgi:hypothetical protein